MNNKIRIFLLVLVVSLVGSFGYSLIKPKNNNPTPITIQTTEEGVDIQIQNFHVTHDVLGQKDWQIKADLAQVDNDNNTVSLKNVDVTLNLEKGRRTRISADSGTLNQASREIELEGHVKFVTDSDTFLNRFQSDASELTEDPKESLETR